MSDFKLLEKHISRYLQDLQQQNKSAHTLNAYQSDLKHLFTLLEKLPTESATPLRQNHILFAVKQLSAQNRHPVTIARKLSAWRQFCHFLVQEHLLLNNPCEGIKPPKRPQRLPKALTEEKTSNLLDNPPVDSQLMIRDKAIFELFYSSGLRLSELTSLNMDSIDREEGLVRVIGKGNKERIVPVGSAALNALNQYLSVRIAKDSEQALFTSQRGNRLTGRQIENRLKQWGIKANSDRNITPHMFRHSFASHILQSSADLRVVQELLGHANLSTTQIYTSLDFQHLAKIYDHAHPRAKKRNKNNSD